MAPTILPLFLLPISRLLLFIPILLPAPSFPPFPHFFPLYPLWAVAPKGSMTYAFTYGEFSSPPSVCT